MTRAFVLRMKPSIRLGSRVTGLATTSDHWRAIRICASRSMVDAEGFRLKELISSAGFCPLETFGRT